MKQKLKAMESLQQKMLEHSRAKTSDKLFSDDKEQMDSSDAEGIIDKLNASTTKILNEIQQIQYKMQPQIHFQERQKQFMENRNKKLNDLRQQQEKQNQEHYKQKPKINPAKTMINKYMEKSLNGKNGDLLKKQDKETQVGDSAKLKGIKFIFSEPINEYQNDEEDGIAVQTSPIEHQIDDNQFSVHHHSKSLYIPIHQRTNYIIQQKNEKMAEIKQQKEQIYEEWLQSLPFKPQLGDCSKSVLTQEEADLFVENQTKWRQQADDWLFQQQINKLNQTPQYTYRPQISRRSTKETTKQSISFHENSNKFTPSNSNTLINQTERKQIKSQKSMVNQFKFKTEERSTIKKAKEQQQLFTYS